MNFKVLIFGVLLAFLLAVGGYYFYLAPGVEGGIQVENAVREQSEEEQTDPTHDGTPAVSNVSNAEMRAELNKLISTDAVIRENSLIELADEFRAGPPRSEGKYSTYGDALFPILLRAIGDQNDRYAKHAIEAIYWMSFTNQLRLFDGTTELHEKFKQEMEKVSHYPVPSGYPPMKDALARVLTDSKYDDARYWAAMALSKGFEPVREIESIFTRQLPLEEENWRVQAAIIGGIWDIGDRIGISASAEPAIIESLQSSNIKTQQFASRLIERHRIDGGLESLVDNVPSALDDINLKSMLRAILSFDSVDESHIAELERIASEANEDDRKQEILSTIKTLRNRSIR